MATASKPQPIYQAIYALVAKIPQGKVATYGQIAGLLNRPRHARQVGYALFQVAPDSGIPWHRVVNAQGKVSCSPARMGSDDLQRWLLQEEAIEFKGDRIDLTQYQWDGQTDAQAHPKNPTEQKSRSTLK